MNIRPLHDRVIVKRTEAEATTDSGIIIPDVARETPAKGQVIAVGPGHALENGTVRALEVKPGDAILFAKFAGTEVKWNGEEHLMMREEDILAVIE